jgi:hypothetical protein
LSGIGEHCNLRSHRLLAAVAADTVAIMGHPNAPHPTHVIPLSREAQRALTNALHYRSLGQLTGRLRTQTAQRIRALRESEDPASLLTNWWSGREPTELNGGTNLVQHAIYGNADYVREWIRDRPTEYLRYRARLAEIVSSERTIQGLSRPELAARADVTVAQIDTHERALPYESLAPLRRILRALRIEPSAIPAPGPHEPPRASGLRKTSRPS